MMRAPRFWFRRPGFAGLLPSVLWPLAKAYSVATRWRVSRVGWAASVPVICMGNINIGGTGKTPAVIALMQHLGARDIRAHALSRGYGGSRPGPLLVDPTAHSAADVGDEPLLIAAFGPCWIARDRALGAKAAIQAGAQAIVLDDGFQNPALVKDVSVLVVDAGQGFGNGRVIPAGPLREPLADGLRRASIVLAIGTDAERQQLHTDWPDLAGLPGLAGRLVPLETGMDWAGARVLAFAGIGRPAKFFETLRGLGAQVLAAHALADHAPISETLLKRLEAEAKALGAQMVTTEKDAARLPKGWNARVLTLPVRLVVDDWAVLDRMLDRLWP